MHCVIVRDRTNFELLITNLNRFLLAMQKVASLPIINRMAQLESN